MREHANTRQKELFVSEATVRRLPRDASYIWKMSRPSGKVIFRATTAIASGR